MKKALHINYGEPFSALAFSNNADRPALMNQTTLPNGRKLYSFILASQKNKSMSFLCIKTRVSPDGGNVLISLYTEPQKN